MQNGKLDIGQFGPLGYVFAQQQAGAEPLASFAGGDGKLSSYTGRHLGAQGLADQVHRGSRGHDPGAVRVRLHLR